MPETEKRSIDAESPIWLRLTIATLLVALLLRLSLIWGGGQGYWPDESRYIAVRNAVDDISRGRTQVGLLELIGTADHLFFKVVSLPAACLDAWFGESQRRAAAYFALFSVAAIALLGSCARAAGASRREAWLAVFFATCANSLFYYSRHLFPYDVSLAFFLASLLLGLRPTSARLSFLAGILSGLGFLTYVGYWLLGAVILLLHVARASNLRSAVLRALAAGAGLVLPLALAILAARSLGGDLILSFRQFSSTVFQGDFGRGHAFVWQYLWGAEGAMLVFWVFAAVYAIIWGGRAGFSGRPWVWLAAAAALYAGLVVCADILRTFVVYGRTARMIVPFACLTAAWSVNSAWSRGRSRGAKIAGGLALAGLVAALNFSAPLAITFSPRFMAAARGLVAASGPGVFRIENARWLRPGERIDDPSQPGDVLLQRRHPLQFEPYMFEGYNEAQRKYLTSHDIGMKLKRMPIPAPADLSGYPGPIRLRIRFPPGRQGASEPLIATGADDNACLVYVHYVDAGHVSFGYECKNAGLLAGSPVPVDYGREHNLLIFSGPMLPGGAPAPGHKMTQAAWERLHHSLLIMLDGRTVMAGAIGVHPSPAGGIKVGVNFGGLTAADKLLSGRIASIETVDPAEVLSRLWVDRAGELRQDPDWHGYPGPVHLKVVLPDQSSELAEPLVTTGMDGDADCLYLEYGANGTVHIDYARFGAPTVRSIPFTLDSDRHLDLIVSMGRMMPPSDSPLYAAHPNWRILCGEDFVEANGKPILARRGEGAVAAPQDIRLFTGNPGNARVSGVFPNRIEAAEAADPSETIAKLPPIGTELVAPPPPDDKYPGPLRLSVTFPVNAEGTAEPLLVTGTAGAGDVIYVQYLKGDKARFGLDHWAYGGPLSPVVDLAPAGRVHEITISDGGLLPPPESHFYTLNPRYRVLRNWVVVAVDGRPILFSPTVAYPALPGQIMTGSNSIGSSTASERFSGDIAKVGFAPPDLVLGWINQASGTPP